MNYNDLVKQGFPKIWVADNGDGTYSNPILHTDFSDPDICEANGKFYMTASSFSNVPGLPILESTDLVNWKHINNAISGVLPFDEYKMPQYGKAVWAPAIRYHNGYFYIYIGFPDEGIYMTRTNDVYGEWEPLHCVKKAKGWIDTCPFWDDDGKMYLVNAFAKSRIGFKSVLALNKLTDDGKAIDKTEDGEDAFKIVYDGSRINPTIEGPKMYKHNDWYYISAPAGGVKTGWQVVMRSKNLWGPYDEEKVVLYQGNAEINGPHQGGWVDINDEESWFVHFQDKGAFGRIVHLQPMKWENDWPVIGENIKDGLGEPVMTYKKPSLPSEEIYVPPTSDDFNDSKLALQWQWNGNISTDEYKIENSKISLYAKNNYYDNEKILWNNPYILTQKFPALNFKVTAKIELDLQNINDRAGMIILGNSYASIYISKTFNGNNIYIAEGLGKKDEYNEVVNYCKKINTDTIYLQVEIHGNEMYSYAYSIDGENFEKFGDEYKATTNQWVGAKYGFFCDNIYGDTNGKIDIDWVYVEEI